jgi:hypothetical protein
MSQARYLRVGPWFFLALLIAISLTCGSSEDGGNGNGTPTPTPTTEPTGTPTSTPTATPTPTPTATPVPGPPTVLSVTAVDYTHVDVNFDRHVTAATAEVEGNYGIAPAKLAGQGIETASLDSDDPWIVHLTLKTTMLPVEYTLTLNNIQSYTGHTIVADTDAVFDGNGKVAFVTTKTGTGNLSSWTPQNGSNVGWLAADTVCQTEATAAGFQGTFKAWLSDNASNAIDRIGADSGPWIRTDGHPLSMDLPTFLLGQVLVPLWFNASGVKAVTGKVWTDTLANGTYYSAILHCANWTLNTGMGGNGEIVASGTGWSNFGSIGCGELNHLYCFQTGAGPAVPALPAVANPKVVFLTSAFGHGDLRNWNGAQFAGGHTDADNICEYHATGKFSNPEKFRAWVSDGASSALAHFTSNALTGPWVLPNGVLVAETLSDLVDGSKGPLTGITVDQNGDWASNAGVWTGTTQTGASTANRCSEWTVEADTSSGTRGRTGFADFNWTNRESTGCDGNSRLYCFEGN